MTNKQINSGSNSRSEDGYEREKQVLKKSLDKTKNWKSLRHTDRKGRPIETIDDFRKGRDGGIDFCVIIETKDEKSAARIQNLYEKTMNEK